MVTVLVVNTGFDEASGSAAENLWSSFDFASLASSFRPAGALVSGGPPPGDRGRSGRSPRSWAWLEMVVNARQKTSRAISDFMVLGLLSAEKVSGTSGVGNIADRAV